MTTTSKIAKFRHRNIIRVGIDTTELARRLDVTSAYVRYLLTGQRTTVSMLERIRAELLSERDLYPAAIFNRELERIDTLIAKAAIE